MPDPARKNMSVTTKVHDIMSSKYKQEKEMKKTDLSLVKWTSEFIMMNLEKEDFVKTLFSKISKERIENGRLTLRDGKLDKLTEIYLKNKKLFCTLDESNNCEHVHYTLTLTELAELKQ